MYSLMRTNVHYLHKEVVNVVHVALRTLWEFEISRSFSEVPLNMDPLVWGGSYSVKCPFQLMLYTSFLVVALGAQCQVPFDFLVFLILQHYTILSVL